MAKLATQVFFGVRALRVRLSSDTLWSIILDTGLENSIWKLHVDLISETRVTAEILMVN